MRTLDNDVDDLADLIRTDLIRTEIRFDNAYKPSRVCQLDIVHYKSSIGQLIKTGTGIRINIDKGFRLVICK